LVVAVAVMDCPAPVDTVPLDPRRGPQGEASWLGVVCKPPFASGLFDRSRQRLLSVSASELAVELGPSAAPSHRAYVGFARQWLAAAQAGLRAGPEGWEDDSFALAKQWQCELFNIASPVGIFHSPDHRVVPAAHGPWLAEQIRTAEVVIEERDGHLALLERRIGDVLDWLMDHFG
jgi:pimeloyl-ACP methyl ester carboxylesterase